MNTEFSNDGAYYAVFTEDGKLKVWETSSSTLKYEYTPFVHLKQPCTCIKWIEISNNSLHKKRKRHENFEVLPKKSIAVGTKSGTILIVSPFESRLVTTLTSEDDYTTTITCLAWSVQSDLISCGNSCITRWNISNGTVKIKWKDDKNDSIQAAVVIENKPHLLTASKTIKLWNYESRELLQTYTGHASDVLFLKCISVNNGNNVYFLSGAKADRFLSCWSLNDNSGKAVAKFITEDIANYVSVESIDESSICLAATVRSGVVHVFKQTLNGKSTKPVKPKVTINVASNDVKNKEISQIPILTAYLNEDKTLLIGYGAQHVITFEKITISTVEKLQCLVRGDPRKLKSQQTVSKTKSPQTQNNVQYLTTSDLMKTTFPVKRKIDSDSLDVPMEQRLENLVLNKSEMLKDVPKSDNLSNLLIQGLKSKDKNILQTVFSNKDELVIKNTIKKLPVQLVSALIKEVIILIQGKTIWCQSGVLWLKHVIQLHASQLLANPDLSELLNPTLNLIQHRVTLLPSLYRLRGRLELLISQITSSATEEDLQQPTLVYQDSDSSNEDDNIEISVQSDNDDQWDEEGMETENVLSNDEHESNLSDSNSSN